MSVLIRPRAFTLSLDPDGPCTITRRRSAGPHLTHRFAGAGGEWTAQTPAPSPIREGDRVSVELDPVYVRVVAA